MRIHRPPFRVVVADPPWKPKDKLPGKGRGAVKHYPVMRTDAICAFSLPPIADDALLFLWWVSWMPADALRVVEAWGFDVKSEIVWLKRTRTGKRSFGMGRYVRMEHEVCLIARRGRAKVRDRSVRSTFEAPMGRHSEKPREFFDIVQRLSAGPYVELFAREKREGWTCLGNEVSR